MKQLIGFALFLGIGVSVHAQAVDTTVCDILKDPHAFNGKTVRIKGIVSSGLDEFIIRGEECHHAISSIWLAYPEGTRAKSGPLATIQLQPAKNFNGTITPVDRAAVVLDKSKDFKDFDALLATPYKSKGMCLGCAKNRVSATLTGRLDAVDPAFTRDAAGKITNISGFGNLNAWATRLVLQSVADVEPRPIDYSKSYVTTKNESEPATVPGEREGAAHAIAKAWGPGNPSGEQVERAAAAFGKPGEDRGVVFGFNGAGEASPSIEQKSNRNSPDGVIYNCNFDSRLKGNAMTVAIVHIGQHVADLRDPQASSLYVLENRAWLTTALAAIGARHKTLTIPGDNVVWSAEWPQADINVLSSEALGDFLAKEALIGQ